MSSASPTKLRPSVFRLAIRRQLVLAIVWGLVAVFSVAGAVVCLAPAAFAWSMRAYRVAAGLLAAFFTYTGILIATGWGLPSFVHRNSLLVVAAAVAWLTLSPMQLTRRNNLYDIWAYAGRLRPPRPDEPVE